MPPYISICCSRLQYHILISLGTRNIRFRVNERGLLKTGALMHAVGESQWNYDPSVDRFRTPLDIKALIQQGYDGAKNELKAEKIS